MSIFPLKLILYFDRNFSTNHSINAIFFIFQLKVYSTQKEDYLLELDAIFAVHLEKLLILCPLKLQLAFSFLAKKRRNLDFLPMLII